METKITVTLLTVLSAIFLYANQINNVENYKEESNNDDILIEYYEEENPTIDDTEKLTKEQTNKLQNLYNQTQQIQHEVGDKYDDQSAKANMKRMLNKQADNVCQNLGNVGACDLSGGACKTEDNGKCTVNNDVFNKHGKPDIGLSIKPQVDFQTLATIVNKRENGQLTDSYFRQDLRQLIHECQDILAASTMFKTAAQRRIVNKNSRAHIQQIMENHKRVHG